MSTRAAENEKNYSILIIAFHSSVPGKNVKTGFLSPEFMFSPLACALEVILEKVKNRIQHKRPTSRIEQS